MLCRLRYAKNYDIDFVYPKHGKIPAELASCGMNSLGRKVWKCFDITDGTTWPKMIWGSANTRIKMKLQS